MACCNNRKETYAYEVKNTGPLVPHEPYIVQPNSFTKGRDWDRRVHYNVAQMLQWDRAQEFQRSVLQSWQWLAFALLAALVLVKRNE